MWINPKLRGGSGTEAILERACSIAATLPDIIWSVEVPSREVLYASPAVEQVFGRSAEEFYARHALWGETLHPDDRERIMRRWREATEGAPWKEQFRIVRPDGGVRWLESHGNVVRDGTGKIIRVDGVSRDITERREQENRIARLSRIHAVLSGIRAVILRARERNQLLEEACRIAVEQGGFGIVWVGRVERDSGLIRAVAHYGIGAGAPAQLTLPPKGAAEVEANAAFRAVHEGKPAFCNDIAAEPTRNSIREIALRLGYRSVISLPLTAMGVVGGVISMYAREPGHFDAEEVRLLADVAGDVSLALERIEAGEKLRFLARYDELTGLPNRALLQERLAEILEAACCTKERTAVAVADIKRFRLINETFGQQVGDALLRELAQRLRVMHPKPGCLARLAADCFALVLPAAGEPQEIAAALEKQLDAATAQPFIIGGRELSVTLVAGVAVCPPDGDDAEMLLRNAEAAHKRLKGAPERVLFYHPEMNSRVAETLLLENRLRRAIAAEQFILHYQPKVGIATGRVVGLEALIRWHDPDQGLVPPAQFIPLMEETGMILEVGGWAIRRALADSHAWRLPQDQQPRIAVNVSQIQLRRQDFVDIVRRALDVFGGEACALDLEITESFIMQDVEDNVRKLAALREMGVHIAIDDFGTGYSSLAYLARLPVNALKIDRSFVHTMTTSSHSLTLVSTIISLAHSLNLEVVAEGVESEEQAKFLRLLKCDEMQGYLFSKPLPAGEVLPQLQRTWGKSAVESSGNNGVRLPEKSS